MTECFIVPIDEKLHMYIKVYIIILSKRWW